MDKKTKSIYDWDLKKLTIKANQIEKDKENGIDTVKAENTSLNECFDKYMQKKSLTIRDSTLTNYIFLYDRFVRDDLGNKKIKNIKKSDIESLYSALLNGKIQYGTLKILHNALHPTFEDAIDDDMIVKNPTDRVLDKIKRNNDAQKEDRIALSAREEEEFMKQAKAMPDYEQYVPIFVTLLGTGMRVGECFALTWDDIDLKNGLIHVNKTLSYRVRSNGNTEFHINSPKTKAGNRTIPMFKEVKAAFIEERKKRMQKGMCKAVIDGYSDFVFRNSRDNVHQSNTFNRVIKNIITTYNEQEAKNAKKEKREAFQIRHFSVHNLRHTFATKYCQLETNLKTIQTVMGHSDISITMKVYAKATEEASIKSFESMEGKFKIG